MNEWMDDALIKDGWRDGWMDDGLMRDGWMDGHTIISYVHLGKSRSKVFSFNVCLICGMRLDKLSLSHMQHQSINPVGDCFRLGIGAKWVIHVIVLPAKGFLFWK